MEKKCKKCGHVFIISKDDFNIEINNKIDLQLLCPKCYEIVAYKFLEISDLENNT